MKAGFSLVLGCVLLTVLGSGITSADPILTIQPSQSTVLPGSTFSLNIDIADVTDLFAFQFDLDFASSVLAATGVTEGAFLASTGEHTFFVPGTIGSGGVSSIADTLIGSGPGVSGSGTLASVNVRYDGGSTPVSFANVLILDSSLHTIAVTTVPIVVPMAVPEPATIMLAAFAICGFAAWRAGWRRSWGGWWSVLPFLAALPQADAASPGYQFTIVAQPGDTIAGKTLTSVSTPLINNVGTLVFSGSFAGGSGIFTPTDLLVKTGDTIAGKTLTSITGFRLTNTGIVAFLGSFGEGSAIFTPSQILVQTGDVIAGKTLLRFPQSPINNALPFDINDAGTFVLRADYQPGPILPNGEQPYGEGIFNNSDLLAYTVAILSPSNFYYPRINNAGTVVFEGDDISGIIQTIYKIPGGTVYISGPEQDVDNPVIADSGGVTFYTAYGGGDENATAISGIVSTNPPTYTGTLAGRAVCGVTPSFAISNRGATVLGAIFEVPPYGCSGGLATLSDWVIQQGDSLGVKTVAFGISSASPSINDAGTIVFVAPFSDGTSAIVMATPIPGSSVLPGDVNGDGVVNCTDLAFVQAALGTAIGQPGFNPRADVNNDGVIDILDLAFVAQHISVGVSCP